MTLVVILAAIFLAIAVATHLVSLAAASLRFREPVGELAPLPAELPEITILRPVRGLETDLEETLGSGFSLSYPNYELIFCCAEADDPVIELVNRLIAAHPKVKAR